MPEQKRKTVRPALEVRVRETAALLGLVDMDVFRGTYFMLIVDDPNPNYFRPISELEPTKKPDYVRVELREFQLRKGLVYLAWSVPSVAAYVVQKIPTFRPWAKWPISFAGGEHVSSSTEGRFLGP